MTRWWTGFVAAVSDVVPLPLLTLALVVGAGVAGALWYWYPAWVPRRLPRLRRPHLRWPLWRWRRPGWRRPRLRSPFAPRRPRRTGEAAAPPAPPSTPAPDLGLADRLAAEGRYAEAIRERLRTVVRQLVDRGVIEQRPGWTVAELTGAAGSALPAVAEPLTEAGQVFSDVWYAQRPADAGADSRMRALAASVDRVLDGDPS